MNTNTTYALILAGVLIVVLVAVFAWAQIQRKRKQQSLNLRQRFGPEYDRTVNELGNRGKAEAELEARTKRVAQLDIVPLAVGEASRFKEAWNAVQARFVDDPKAAVVKADRLVYELMAKRGYPMGDFEARAADISVDHPGVVSNYRAARAITLADESGQADTELLRRAVVHYRALFDELLVVREAEPSVLRAEPVA
ncbi:MAG TPA: hypothetical protein VK715_05970 [Steroidobacteraceae bacterium]|nr:hypothetical protein [Steroidobacteraceae bacterium]